MFEQEIFQLKNDIQDLVSSYRDLVLSNRVQMCGVGLQNYDIRDEQITSSSHWMNEDKYGATNGRLFRTTGFGAWCAGFLGAYEWIEVDLGRDQTITAVVTQGKHNKDQWVTSYLVSHRCDSCDDYTYVTTPSPPTAAA